MNEKRINLIAKILILIYQSGLARFLPKREKAEIDRLVADLSNTYRPKNESDQS